MNMVKSVRIDKVKEEIEGYLFILPNLLMFVFIFFIPFLYALYLTVTDGQFLNGLLGCKFTGLENYFRLTGDEIIWKSLYNNVVYSLVTVVFGVGLALIMASIINKGVFFSRTLRIIYFLPYMSSAVAAYIVWYYMYSPDGPINGVLKVFGISSPPLWMLDYNVTLYALCTISIWGMLGYNMLIYIAGIQGIPQELYESARIDGANGVQQFLHVTFPMLYPTTFFLAVTSMIGTFQGSFTLLNLTTKGGPGTSTMMLVYYIYDVGFKRVGGLGYASTVAFLLFLIVMTLTLFMWKQQKKLENWY